MLDIISMFIIQQKIVNETYDIPVSSPSLVQIKSWQVFGWGIRESGSMYLFREGTKHPFGFISKTKEQITYKNYFNNVIFLIIFMEFCSGHTKF